MDVWTGPRVIFLLPNVKYLLAVAQSWEAAAFELAPDHQPRPLRSRTLTPTNVPALRVVARFSAGMLKTRWHNR
jgi:hypothetical protein